jgi:hypothetical protein
MNDASPTQPAGQPTEAKVEQRHHDLVTKVFAPYCEIITEVLDNEAAQLLANLEARAVAALEAQLDLLLSRHEARLAAFEEYKKVRDSQLAQAEAALAQAKKVGARLREALRNLVDAVNLEAPGGMYIGGLTGPALIAAVNALADQSTQRLVETINEAQKLAHSKPLKLNAAMSAPTTTGETL